MNVARLLLIGGWGHHYLAALAGRPGVGVAVAGDGHNDMARLRADQIDGAVWFDDVDTALAEFAPDVVSVGGVYGLNGDHILRALGAGVAVVSDKPIARTSAQVDAIETAARDAGRPVLTELPLRCDAAVRSARRAVEEGRIGEPVLATAQKSYKFGGYRPDWYRDPELYTGTVLWIATHGLDLVGFVTGRSVTPLAGHVGNVSKPEFGAMEDHTTTLLALDNGGSAVVHADYLRPEGAPGHGDDRVRVAGSEGVVEVRDGRCVLLESEGSTDVTDDALGLDVHDALLAALDGDADLYSTEHSLALARLGLVARGVSAS